MAVEAEAAEALKISQQTPKYPSKTFIYSIHHGERNLWRLVRPRNRII
jgi:hypothetical protein